jgi:hypothetical protein
MPSWGGGQTIGPWAAAAAAATTEAAIKFKRESVLLGLETKGQALGLQQQQRQSEARLYFFSAFLGFRAKQ